MSKQNRPTEQDYREVILDMLGKIHSERCMRLIYRFVQSIYINRNGDEVKS